MPDELPLLPLKDTIVYPLTVYPLVIGKEKSIKLVNDVTMGDKIPGLTAQKKMDAEVAGTGDIHAVGTMARILQMIKVPDGTLRSSSRDRAHRHHPVYPTEPYIRARVQALPDKIERSVEIEALMRSVAELFQRWSPHAQYAGRALGSRHQHR